MGDMFWGLCVWRTSGTGRECVQIRSIEGRRRRMQKSEVDRRAGGGREGGNQVHIILWQTIVASATGRKLLAVAFGCQVARHCHCHILIVVYSFVVVVVVVAVCEFKRGRQRQPPSTFITTTKPRVTCKRKRQSNLETDIFCLNMCVHNPKQRQFIYFVLFVKFQYLVVCNKATTRKKRKFL